ncbi:TPA: hypothetical protein CPT80_06540 [Candidatus Gastranaerophilales bacterium HUM_9]|nr:MAG TPA: hypothetical protein CPT80_06540 [Candidatus Gastranaerophilales bacterium HUM_9]HBX34294.1 hypothetical protein [Cyanobacteria bacterium UBA11440]
MPFRYKLQKVLDFRIRKKEEQEAVVSRARQKLREAEQRIEENKQEILQVSTAKRTADYSLMEYYDKYLHHLWDKAETLEQERQVADDELQIEIKKLIECEQNVKVLEKHKDKQKELYIEEEKKAELKQFSELGVQRHFIRAREQQEEEEMLEELMRQQEEDDSL